MSGYGVIVADTNGYHANKRHQKPVQLVIPLAGIKKELRFSNFYSIWKCMFKCFFHHHNLEYNFKEKTGVCKNCGAKSDFNLDTTNKWAGMPDKNFSERMMNNFVNKILPKDSFLKSQVKGFTDLVRFNVVILFISVFLFAFINTGSVWWGLFWAFIIMALQGTIR